MVAYKGMPKATLEELLHMSIVKQLPCCHCVSQKTPTQVHHITVGGRRLGHFYVLPECQECHALPHFEAEMREKWEAQNQQMDVQREWPESKIVPRRSA